MTLHYNSNWLYCNNKQVVSALLATVTPNCCGVALQNCIQTRPFQTASLMYNITRGGCAEALFANLKTIVLRQQSTRLDSVETCEFCLKHDIVQM